MEAPEIKEVAPSEVTPKVVYDKSLQSPGVPYTVNVDAQKLGDLMRELGIPNEQIESTRITIKRRLLGVVGRFNALTGNITIGTDYFWELKNNVLKRASEIAEQKRAPKREEFKDTLYTKRLAYYLAAAPYERGVKFANNLIERGIARKAGAVLIHETQHKIDRKNLPLQARKFASYSGVFGLSVALPMLMFKEMGIDLRRLSPDAQVLIGGLQINLGLLGIELAYLVDPAELSANKVEKEKQNLPVWRNLITISPKIRETTT